MHLWNTNFLQFGFVFDFLLVSFSIFFIFLSPLLFFCSTFVFLCISRIPIFCSLVSFSILFWRIEKKSFQSCLNLVCWQILNSLFIKFNFSKISLFLPFSITFIFYCKTLPTINLLWFSLASLTSSFFTFNAFGLLVIGHRSFVAWNRACWGITF